MLGKARAKPRESCETAPQEPICTNNDISQYTICERHHREDPESDQVVRDHNTRETYKETERYPM